MPPAEIVLVDSETIGLRFAFDASLVRQIRALNSRRWNPKQKRWEVHIAHLAEVMRIFFMHPNDAPPEVLEIYRDRWLRNQLRLIMGNTTCRLSGASVPVQPIDRALSFPVNGHEYSLKFIEGAWDGHKHLFNRRDLSFPTGLLPAVQKILHEHSIEAIVEDERPSTPPQYKWKAGALELRNYQKEAVRSAVKLKRGILEMATGSGKTVVAAKIISRLKRQTLFFVHTKDLLHQARRLLGEYLGEEIGQVGDGVIDLKPITVATIQTAVRAFGGQYGKSVDEDVIEEDYTDLGGRKHELANHIQSTAVIFFDECHHVPAETCYALAMRTDAAEFRYGLSATPYRADHHDMLLEAALGPKIFRANSSRLIDMGYLVPSAVRFVAVPGGVSRRDHSDYRDIYQRCIIESDARNKRIAQEARALAKAGKSVLMLVREVAHGEALHKLLPKAKFIQGSDAAKKRAKVLRDLEQKKALMVIATTLADEGLDVPTLDAVILAGGGRSETKALQRIGRALRPSPGKEKAEIIDFFDQAPYLIDHSRKRFEIYSSEPRFEVNDGGIAALQQQSNPGPSAKAKPSTRKKTA